MAEPGFPILDNQIALVLNRSEVMRRLWAELTKPTPSNLSIVGPPYVGKTLIMNALAARTRSEPCLFQIVLHWRFGDVGAMSDTEFVAELCDKLGESLAHSSTDSYAEHREYLADHSFGCLKEVTDLLDSEGTAILMLWDDFDKPLEQGALSGHLWDQMRTIFYGRHHRIVTATRRPLSESIPAHGAITSSFWNMFDSNPVRVGAIR